MLMKNINADVLLTFLSKFIQFCILLVENGSTLRVLFQTILSMKQC